MHRCFVLFLVLAMLSACSLSGESPAAPSDVPAATGVPSPAPPPPTDAPPITALPQPSPEASTLTLWAVGGDEAQAEPLQRLIADAARQAGVELSVAVKSPDTLQADVRTNALAGLPQPDLFWGNQEDLGLLQRDGLLLPAEDAQPPEAFIPSVVASATLDGQRWGTPVAADDFLLLLYNKQIVSAPPQTSDALITAARDINRGDQAGLVAAWAEPRWFAAWLAGAGGTLVGPDDTPTLDTPEVIATFNLLKELRAGGPPAPSTYRDGVALFTQGDAAFNIDGDWALDGYRQYTDTLDLGVARMPLVPGTRRVAAPPLNGIYLMRGKDLPDVRRAKAQALAQALVAPATQAQIARDLRMLPALQAALSDDAVQGDPVLAAAAAQIDGALALPATKGLRCAWRVLGVALPSVLLDETTPEDAAARMQADALACVQAQ